MAMSRVGGLDGRNGPDFAREEGLSALCPDGGKHFADSQYAHNTLEVVGKYMQAHLGPSSAPPLRARPGRR